MVLLEDKGRDYRRYAHDAVERLALARRGLRPVLSSNVSAVGVFDNDLVIRFHNGSLYRYYDMAESFDSIMASNSKGRWVWNYLRRKNVPYSKTTLSLEQDLQIDDERIISIGKRIRTLGDLPTTKNYDKIIKTVNEPLTETIERLRNAQRLVRGYRPVSTRKYAYLS